MVIVNGRERHLIPKIIESGLAECAGFSGRAKLVLAICKLGKFCSNRICNPILYPGSPVGYC